MKSKTPQFIIALLLAGPSATSAVQLQNINSKFRKYQDLANKQQLIKNDVLLQLSESKMQPYDVAAEERDTDNGYPATYDLDLKYPGNDHEAITKNAQKFIDKKTGYMKTVYEVELEEKAEKAKELQEKIDAAPGLGFKLNTDMVIPDDTGEKYHTTHLCYGSPCPKKDSFAQTGSQSLAQMQSRHQQTSKDIDYLLGDDTGERYVKFGPTGNPKKPEYHDVHFMLSPEFNQTVWQKRPSFAQQKHVDDITDDSADKWVYWPRTGKDPDPLYHDVHYMIRPDFNVSTLQWPRSLAQSHSEQQDDYKYDDWTGDRWVKYPRTGKEPFPPPHDPEWYKKDDFMHTIYQPIKPAASLAQKKSKDDGALDDWTGDRWARYANDFGREPFPPPHNPQWYTGDDFWHSVYQGPNTLAQHKTKDDGALDDWTGDRWAKYANDFGREPFPPPHNPEWYTGDDFWHSVYQSPQSLVQLDEQYNGAYAPSEPYDTTLKDVDKIMDYYKEKDAKDELQKKVYELPDDPSGGINSIYAASLQHTKAEDTQYLKNLFEQYSMGGKGPNGMPNGERILNKEQMQLAAEEVINTWVTVSDGAMKEFEKENFDKVWNQYDNFNKGQIDLDDGIPVLRSFMESEQPTEKTEDEKNPYMNEMAKEEEKEMAKKQKAELISKVIDPAKQAKKEEKKKKAAEDKESEESAEEEGKLPETNNKKTAGEDDAKKNTKEKAKAAPQEKAQNAKKPAKK